MGLGRIGVGKEILPPLRAAMSSAGPVRYMRAHMHYILSCIEEATNEVMRTDYSIRALRDSIV